jgi:hypothetical protein
MIAFIGDGLHERQFVADVPAAEDVEDAAAQPARALGAPRRVTSGP